MKEAAIIEGADKVVVSEEWTTYVKSGDVILSEKKEVVKVAPKYDATGLKEEELTVNNKTYQLIPEKSDLDKLTGEVSEGELLLTLIYKEKVKPVEPVKPKEVENTQNHPVPTPQSPQAPVVTQTKVSTVPVPVQEQPAVKATAASLPNTGESGSIVSFIGGLVSSIGALGLGLMKRGKTDETH